MTSEPHAVAAWAHAAIWLAGGAVLLAYSATDMTALLRRAEPFRLSDGAEQSVLIFLLVALASLVQAAAQLPHEVRNSWLAKVLAVPLLLGSAVWLFFGGPAHEPWPFSVAVTLVFIAALWQMFVRNQ